MSKKNRITDFKTPSYNPRRISRAALNALSSSMKIFGDLSGIVVNARTSHIVCANQRRAALEGVALSAIKWGPRYSAELGDAGGRFESRERRGSIAMPGGAVLSIREVDWPLDFEKAANVAANNPALQGEFTENIGPLLADLQKSLGPVFDELNFGTLFESAGLDPEKKAKGKTNPDAIPEIAAPPVSVLGKSYALGTHRVTCGDFAAAAPGTVDMVFTDPPYNMNYKSRKLGGIMNDALGDAAFTRLILASAGAIQKNLKRGGSYYICMSGASYPVVCSQLRKIGMKFRVLVWVKPSAGLGAQDYRPQFEVMLYGHTGSESERMWNGGRTESDVWEFDPDRGMVARETGSGGMALEFGDEIAVYLDKKSDGIVLKWDGACSDVWKFGRESRYLHPTQKPVALVERALRNSSRPGAVVWDLFAGSGTTIMAGESLGRPVIAHEKDPQYVDIIRKRWAEFVHGPGCDWQSLTPEIT